MTGDLANQIEALQQRLADLSSAVSQQASTGASDASSYLIPRAREAAQELGHGAIGLSRAVRQSPGTTTGAALAGLAIGTLIGFFLAGSRRDNV